MYTKYIHVIKFPFVPLPPLNLSFIKGGLDQKPGEVEGKLFFLPCKGKTEHNVLGLLFYMAKSKKASLIGRHVSKNIKELRTKNHVKIQEKHTADNRRACTKTLRYEFAWQVLKTLRNYMAG